MSRSTSLSENYLDNIPTRRVDQEDGENDHLVLLQPRPMTGILGRWLQPRLPLRHFRIKLDEIGTEVWQLVDGTRTVGEIADILAEKMGDKIEPRYERVATFIRTLHQQNAVAVFTTTRDRD